MPQHYNLFVKVILQGILDVTITIRTRENDDTEFHVGLIG
jgi:hypothetical protein